MKKLIASTILIAVLFFSCKKNDTINTSEVRLLKMNWKDINGTVNGSRVFDYDQQGRIIRISATGNFPTTVEANVAYSGSDIIITPTASVFPQGGGIVQEIRYTVDASGRPLRRIESSTFIISDLPQYTYKTDTANFEYDGARLLTKKINISKDSTWFNPDGTPVITIVFASSVTVYTNANNSLSQIDKTGFDSTWYDNGTISNGFSRNISETYKFDYSKNYKNEMDFMNSVILTEYAVLPGNFYPINMSYSNFPDGFSMSSVTKDVTTGQIVDTQNEAVNFAIGNNKYGFISNLDTYLTNGDLASSQSYTYSK